MKTATKTQLQINKYYSKIVSMCLSAEEVVTVRKTWTMDLLLNKAISIYEDEEGNTYS